ncbi:glycyl radical enzyme [Desulfosarcina ovata subsp. sediminis]|uniref:Glycyl radical enzyme n=1 Tax=Desulfosarcina ovata subsp. sediminis TaxID=885957 RepID=A0A5K7ZN43_9BACT|nr:pyruvate formate lyase family protein [Desulfosarcina ovata]BBO80999.1 glycyl radical enzyme [Desulfosarcina ovata subsp. sediminis]
MTTVAPSVQYQGQTIDFPLENPEEMNVSDDRLTQTLASPSTERTKRLKARCRFKHTAAGEFVNPDLKGGIERARYFTEGFKNAGGKPYILRRAESIANVLNKTTIVLQEDELIIGFNAEHPEKFPLFPETSHLNVIDFINSPYCPEEKEEAVELVEYWEKYGLVTKGARYFSELELQQMYQFSTMEAPAFANAYNSTVPPYETIMEDGLNKRIAMAEENIARAKAELAAADWNGPERLPLLDKIDTWEAMIIVDQAVINWAQRHGRMCRIVAEKFESDAKRQAELMEIADICQRVPAEPCRGLRDAMQVKWFTYLVCHAIETYASGYAHKEDKVLWPYYQVSVIDQSFQPMTHADVVELVECERLKVSEHGCGKNRAYRSAFAGSNDLFILTLGGTNKDGSDGCNDMTDAILQAAKNIRTTEPSIGFRWSPKGRKKTKRLVFECIRDGLGFPSIKNDELATEQLMAQFGASEEEARDWALVLCMSPGHCGRRKAQKVRTEGGGGSFTAKVFEITLSDGFDWSFSGFQMGPKSGDPRDFKTFDELWEVFRKQSDYVNDMLWRTKDVTRKLQAKYLQLPFLSSLDDGCMERGIDAVSNTELPNPWLQVHTAIVACNSLTAIKKLVYDEKKYTMAQLIEALHANWEGYEEMRRDFAAAPKWGNDDDYADAIVKAYWEDILAEKYKRIVTYSGAHPLAGSQAVAVYLHIGSITGPTPDGRFGGEACDDGGVSPMAGTDKLGPTAVLRSLSKIDSSKFKFNLLNQRLSVPLMRSKHGFDIWHAYMKTWHDLKIDHVQFNCVSTEEMLAAQKEPEQHEDLIVRVAGYSARFVDISTYAQNTIIKRNVQGFGPAEFDKFSVEFSEA